MSMTTLHTQNDEAGRRSHSEEELKDFSVWRCMIFGQYNIKEVLACVKDEEWQGVRISMLNTSRRYKFDKLQDYINDNKFEDGSLPREVMVRVTNYIYALRRGGIIK